MNCFHRETGKEVSKPDEFEMFPGRGVKAKVEGKEILAGNLRFLAENQIKTDGFAEKGQEYLDQGCTVIYTAVNGIPAGITAMADVLRNDMWKVMKSIIRAGADPVLLTGDNERAANAIARQLHISKVEAGCLPEDKLNYIEESQELGHKICMIGDGVNDAPALKKAYVGIAMGGVGSDIAVDAADIALVEDKIEELPHLLSLSKRMMTTIKWNLTFSLALNFIAIALAITGILNPVVGALVHNTGSVLVIMNSVLLLNWKSKAE